MCSQYQLVSDMNAFQTQLAIDLEDIIRRQASDFAERQDDESLDDDAAFENLSGIRRPTDPVIVVLPGQKPALRRWGLSVSSLNAPLINARAETIDQKPTFRSLLERRCLIPATSWFEWRKEGTARHKTRITLPDHQPVLFDHVRHMLGPVPDHVLEWSEEMPDRAKAAQHDDGQITLF